MTSTFVTSDRTATCARLEENPKMVTIKSRSVEVDRRGAPPNQDHCPDCRRVIVWMSTYPDGTIRPFENHTLPREYDDGTGWVPGRFPIGQRQRVVLAPLCAHPPEKQRRIRSVMTPHRCPGRAA
jgi:hypothetical protein